MLKVNMRFSTYEVFDSAPPELMEGQTELEFHLIYQGKLPAAGQSNTRTEKSKILGKFSINSLQFCGLLSRS
ncbi:MAG: hypothetical protein NVS9B5_32410 [Terriglobales bacterium]